MPSNPENASRSTTSYKSSESEYEEMRKNPTDTNVCNTSAVVWINIYDTNFLFLSDVSSSVLKKIANSYLINQSGYCPMGEKFVNLEKCDVLKVSDHGHMRGANTQFHSLIKPDHAVICAGKNSREDCPSAKVIADLTLNASVYITENYGDVTFKITNTNYFLIKE